MGQLVSVLLFIDKAHTVPQKAPPTGLWTLFIGQWSKKIHSIF